MDWDATMAGGGVEFNWRENQEDLKSRFFGCYVWVGGHSIYQDEGLGKEEIRVNGMRSGTPRVI